MAGGALGRLVHVRLLGTFEATVDGRRVDGFESDKVRAVLSLLAVLPDREHSRETLAAMLWPESGPEAALTSLRNALRDLRRVMGDPGAEPLLEGGRRSIRWAPRVAVTADATEIERLVSSAARHAHRSLRACASCRERLSDAAALYQGDLLAGLTVRDCPAFEEWRTGLQARLLDGVLGALDVLGGAGEDAGAWDEACRHARRALAIEPWCEPAHRRLMRGLARLGRRGEALRQYAWCVQILGDELGVAPAPATQALRDRIEADAWEEPRPSSGNLPAPADSMVGRASERRLAAEMLGSGRMVTVVGPAGCGKTRLALEVAREAAPGFADGAYLIPVAPATGPEHVLHAIGGALEAGGLQTVSAPGAGAEDRLPAILRRREVLLVLDNCEHLAAACAALAALLLRACPHVCLLATSREPLAIAGEAVLRIGPLPVPPDGDRTADAVLRWEAAQLFAVRAASAQGGFRVTDANAGAVADLCRLLDGLPLALELAAARLRGMTFEQIALQVTDRFRVLRDGRRDDDTRHRSLEALLDWSYEYLRDAEQAVWRRLAVFQAPAPPEAAAHACAWGAVPPADLPTLLAGLVEKSIVLLERRNGAPAYGLLRSVRAYGLDRLGVAEEGDAVRERHLEWHVAWARASAPYHYGEGADAWARAHGERSADVQAAVRWALAHHRGEAAVVLAQAAGWSTRLPRTVRPLAAPAGTPELHGADPLVELLLWFRAPPPGPRDVPLVEARLRAAEAAGDEWGHAAALLRLGRTDEAVAPARRAAREVRAWALTWAAHDRLRQRRWDDAASLAEEALEAHAGGAWPAGRPITAWMFARAEFWRGRPDRAAALLEPVLAFHRRHRHFRDLLWIQPEPLLDMAVCLAGMGRFAEARDLFAEAVAYHRRWRWDAGLADDLAIWAHIGLGRAPAEAAYAMGAVAGYRTAHRGAPEEGPWAVLRPELESRLRALAEVRREIALAWARGEAASVEDAAEALFPGPVAVVAG